MASDLAELYEDLRAVGRGHQAAIAELARRIDVDQATVGRVLRRAAADDERDRRRSRTPSPSPTPTQGEAPR